MCKLENLKLKKLSFLESLKYMENILIFILFFNCFSKIIDLIMTYQFYSMDKIFSLINNYTISNFYGKWKVIYQINSIWEI